MAIEHESGEVVETLEPVLAEILKPERTGIIVVDMQGSYVKDWPQKIGGG